MENDEIVLEDSPSEGGEELELEPTGTTKEPEELGDDPLDAIQDEVARAEAKKHRAIARRVEKKEKAPQSKPETKQNSSSQEFLTKADFFKANERKAIREATADPEVKANWTEIAQFYTPRRGKETAEDIAEDIKDAVILFKARNPEVVTDDSKNQLTTTGVVKTGGAVDTKVTPKTPNPPNFKLPTTPSEWYPKKS